MCARDLDKPTAIRFQNRSSRKWARNGHIEGIFHRMCACQAGGKTNWLSDRIFSMDAHESDYGSRTSLVTID